jgi:DNA-binding beta-propeller fold protein YncE
LAVAPWGDVYVAETYYNHRIHYFTGSGSFLGRWGSEGSGPGQFDRPADVAFSPSGDRLYVVELLNNRVQYFREGEPAVEPTSMGKVKAVFK